MPRRTLAAAAALALLAGCTGNTGGGSRDVGVIRLSDGRRATDRGTAEVRAGSIEIAMGEFYFEPTVVEGEPGASVTVHLRNEGENVHNFEIAPLGIDVTLAEGQTETVTVALPNRGALVFECKFHLPRDMRGEFRTF